MLGWVAGGEVLVAHRNSYAIVSPWTFNLMGLTHGRHHYIGLFKSIVDGLG